MHNRVPVWALLGASLVVLTSIGICSIILHKANQVGQIAASKEIESRRSNTAAAVSVQPSNDSVLQQAVPSESPTNLRFVSWNIESDGNDPATIAEQLIALGRYDIFALQEVKNENVGRYGDAIRKHLGESYRYLGSTTGGSDRLMIVFDSARLRLREVRELFSFGEHTLNGWRHRSPMVATFYDLQTTATFDFMTVHLARGAGPRLKQAVGLREWAAAQSTPIVAIGDFNMDYEFATNQGNAAFDAFLGNKSRPRPDGMTHSTAVQSSSNWRWIRPPELIDTNWYDPEGDGTDNYPGSCLDFAFTTIDDTTRFHSKVIVREGDFPDDDKTSDHRPIELVID